MTTSAGRLVCTITQCFRAQELCEKRGELCENEVDVLGFMSQSHKVKESNVFFTEIVKRTFYFQEGGLLTNGCKVKYKNSAMQKTRNTLKDWSKFLHYLVLLIYLFIC